MSGAMPVFDTYKYINALKAAGFTEAQAEAQSSALVGAFDAYGDRLATKEDLRVLGAELRTEMAEIRGEMRGMRSEIDQVRNMLRWVAGPSIISMMGTVTGAVLLLAKSMG
ncbi:MAG TPA: hypothetical protein VGC69_02250 [Bordetella sp.]